MSSSEHDHSAPPPVPARRADTPPERPSRRFGDEDIARILARAAEMQESGRPAPTGGLTLAELRQVAAEAGIDPRFVDLAATEGRGAARIEESRISGGPVAWNLDAHLDGEVPHEDRDRIVQAIRVVLGEKGELSDVYGRMEWSHDDGLGPTIVGVTSRDGGTHIDVSSRRGTMAGLILGVGVPFGAMAGGGVIAALVDLQGAGVIPAIVASGALVYLAGRAGWGVFARGWQRRMERLLDAVTTAASSVAVPAADASGERPPDEES